MTVPRGAARAVADVSKGVILASVEIEAPPERVFAALSTPEVAEWWGSAETYRVERWTADLRPSGEWRSEGVDAGGKPFSVGGRILEIDPPRLLVQTWIYDWARGGSTTVRYEIEATPTGSRLTVRHEGFTDAAACEGHASGWERVLGWLANHLRRGT